MKYFFAPIQGHTDAAYRYFHSKIYGCDLIYTTPFIRLEHNALRPKDIKDLKSDLNQGLKLLPQIIFRDKKELESLVDLIKKEGYKEIDLNMGCPFPLQTGHKRGAATVANEELAKYVAEIIRNNPDIKFSVKIRLGMENENDWKILLPYLNEVELTHLTVHPRVAKQQYGGELHLNQFEEILKESKNPIVFNGDIKTPQEAKLIIEKYPTITGIMIGRGALRRPSIFNEIIKNEEFPEENRIYEMKKMHSELLDHYENVLCGDSQILSKIKPFWEYAENEIGRKVWKSITKAKTLPKYKTALASI